MAEREIESMEIIDKTCCEVASHGENYGGGASDKSAMNLCKIRAIPKLKCSRARKDHSSDASNVLVTIKYPSKSVKTLTIINVTTARIHRVKEALYLRQKEVS